MGDSDNHHVWHGTWWCAAQCQLDGGRNLQLFSGGGDGADGGLARNHGNVDSDRYRGLRGGC
jgi:hypothetical protein